MSQNGRHAPADAGPGRRNRTIAVVVAIGLVAFGGGYLVAQTMGGDDPTVQISSSPSPITTPTVDPTTSPTSGATETPPATDLDDGAHLIRATAAATTPDGSDLTFDLAIFFAGADAFEYAEENDIALDNDYLIINDSPKLRTLPLASDATVEYIPLGTCCDLQEGDVDAFVASVNGTNPTDYPDPAATWWRATIEGGVITGLVQQYLP